MPFTPSHAVVALPFVRTPLVPAAIAVGAMTPDLPLFVRGMVPSYAHTHDFAWIPLTVLLALALLLLWRCVLRPASRELAPAWLAERLPKDWDEGAGAALAVTFGIRAQGAARVGRAHTAPGDRALPLSVAKRTALLLLALGIGVATHIVWDLFTHEGRAGSRLIPLLAEEWCPVLGLTLPGYKWAQHGSSVVGLAILAVYALIWLRHRAPTRRAQTLPGWVRVSWWLSLPLLLLGAWVWGMAVFGPFSSEWTAPHLAYRVLPPASAVFGAITVALCIGIQIVHARARRIETPR